MRYLQLVHNTWDPAAGAAKMKVLHSFGREDQLDRAAIERLIASLSKLLRSTGGLVDGADADASAGGSGLEFVSSKVLGATWALDGVWSQLGLDTLLRRLLKGTRRSARTERVIFGLVAARAIEPGSKLATAGWLTRRTHIPGLTVAPAGGEPMEVSEDECYRAMDWLIDAAPQLEREVFWSVASLLDLDVDLLFFDTTSTYFEIDEDDEPVLRDDRGQPTDPVTASATGADAVSEPMSEATADGSTADGAPAEDADRWRAGFRTWGKSKDARGDLPQNVIGMAVTRTGIPVRVWSWPGNTTDSALIRQAKADLREWNLGRVVWVGDRGFTSAANRADLRRGGHAYILGEKLRSGSADAQAALARPGRYATVAGNLQVKEVKIADDERFVVCFNPDQATRDAALREVMISKLETLIAGSDALSATKRAELAGKISAQPGPYRYLRRTPAGLLRVDRAKAAAEAKLDGKYLLRCSDPNLSAADIALGYKQLIQVERGWRDLKTHLELRPVYHRLETRIRAHVLLCWLALLLVRIVETTTGRTWTDVREDLSDLHVGMFSGQTGTFAQTSTPTPGTRDTLAALGLPPPKKILDLRPAATAEPAADALPSQDLAAS
ncbi:IS1634 family transposase [Blastococcus tunisiensis]|uniref:Transposase DDE domain-containing protein n=1 Tax=Blastococcus tunisiensis TaxID=1798228 RepID=A0A1I2MHV9_9ACTN|nr:IS1634 family transposase [Blastococcus sp. DSM 46838]SFF91074.1 Transposase DDE domain-containing protein [Blastococcus sp. DSM 46838]